MSVLGLGLGLPFNRSAAVAVDPGLALLQSATLWLDASDIQSGDQWIRNKGTGGPCLNARLGSVGKAQLLGAGHGLMLPGSTGNYASTPDAAALDLSTEFDIIMNVMLADWSPAASVCLLAKESSGTTRSFRLEATNTSRLAFSLSNDGSTLVDNGINSGTSHTFVDGTFYWIRYTWRGSDGRSQTFFAADSADIPTSWTQLGSNFTALSTSIFNSTSPLEIGSRFLGSLGNFQGAYKRVVIRSTIDGPAVFDANFNAATRGATSLVENSSNAATVTINAGTGIDTNDPLPLPHTGTNYLYLSGVAGNAAVSSSIANYYASSSIDVRVRCALEGYGTALRTIMSHFHAGATANWLWRTTAGGFNLTILDSGAITHSYVSSAHGLVDGTTYWLRLFHEAGGFTRFFYALDQEAEPSSWTQIGSDIVSTNATIRNAACLLTVGARGSIAATDPAPGKFFRAIFRADSVVQYDADFTANTDQSSFTESSSNAATVTISRSTSGRKAVMVTRPVWLFGTDDYMEVADNSLLNFNTEDFTVLSVTRSNPNVPSNARVISKRASATGNYGWELIGANTASLADFYGMVDSPSGDSGTDPGVPADIQPTALVRSLIGFVVDDSAGTLAGFLGSTLLPTRTLPADRNFSNTTPLSIGRFAGASSYFDGEIDQVAVFRQALNSTELGQIMSYLGIS